MQGLIHIGDKRKQIRFQDEIKGIIRRKSSRVIALEEKKQQERERKLAMALEKKNKVNHEIRNKGKGKATMEVGDNLSDFNENEKVPTKKGHKSKELYQLISSIKVIQESGRHSQNASASGTNDSSLNGMPLKKILQIIIDFLQRKDPDELFAEPISPDDVGENYYKIVKQPMDFGTMRAKLHEDMYTDLEQFKRDIFLICSNAMSTNPKTSKYHLVVEDIKNHAKLIFEALSAEPQHIEVEFPQNKRRPGKKPENGQLRTPQRVTPKPDGRKNTTEIEKRGMYWPPSKPLVAEVLDGDKSDIQLNEKSFNYKESLLRFAEELGPTAQRIAAKKIEALPNQELCNGDSPSQNLLENASGTQIIHQGTPQIPRQPDHFNAQTLALGLPFFNRTLRIPGSAAPGNRTVNTNAGRVNINVSSGNVPSIVHPTIVISGHQPRQEESVNLSERFVMSQTRRRYSMYDMPGNILTGRSLMHQHQPMPADSMCSLNPLRLFPLCQPNQGELTLSTSTHPGNSQAILDSADFNNSTGTVQGSHEQVMHQAAPYTPPATQGYSNMQMLLWQEPLPLMESKTPSSLQEAPPQLLRDNDQQPNLELQL